MLFSLIGLGLLVAAAGLFVFRRRTAANQAASINWPVCDGQIAESYVDTFKDKDRWTNYMARVKYAYQVNGTNHKSERITWGGSPYSRVATQANETVARYPAGSGVEVYYNPDKPDQAVLDPASKAGVGMLTFLTVVVAVIGLAFLAFGILGVR